MTQPVSRPPSAPEGEPGSEEPTTEFVAHDPGSQPPHSAIDQEIARSERASAALAATRALARAAFTDSQLAADDAAAGEDAAQDAIDTEWVRTEYVALEQTLPPDDEARRDGPPRHLVGGSFNPGIAPQHGRTYPGASMADASLKTRTGAQAQFHHEARHAPRAEALPATGHPARPVVTPAQAAAPSRAHSPTRAPRRDGLRFLLAAGLGGVVVLAGGGLAWRTGMLSRAAAPVTATAPAATTPSPAAVAAQAEAARVLSPAAPQEIPVTPAAGPTPSRTSADVDAALAAAARAAAVPAASVRAAVPAPAARPQQVAAPVPASAATPAVRGKADVAAAIANAQARADRFLSSGSGDAAAPASTEAKQAP